MASHLAFTTGGICALGGLIGFIRKRSLPSLIAGSAFGAMYAAAGYLMSTNSDYGTELALGTSTLLLLAMGPRAIKSQKPMPVALAVLGSFTGVFYARKYYDQINGV